MKTGAGLLLIGCAIVYCLLETDMFILSNHLDKILVMGGVIFFFGILFSANGK